MQKGPIHHRIPEPEIMDEAEQVRAYAEADFSKTDRAMADRIRAFCAGSPPQRILDLGCGPGNIAFLLAEVYPDATVLGIDGASHMIGWANKKRERTHGHLKNLRFEIATLPTVSGYYPERFDLVVSNSLLHHLHDPFVLWKEIKKAAAPGARIFVADLRRPATFEQAREFRETYAGDAPAVLKHDFYCSLLASFSQEEIEEQLVKEELEGFTIELPTDRHVYCYGFRR